MNRIQNKNSVLTTSLSFSVSECSQVIGIEGQNITLPFKYDAKSHGLQHICWGKGTIPSSGGCDNEIISTDGSEVTRRSSVRYQLLGELKTGDVTLTISKITENDSGIYGCRVQYAGWFNDEKYHVSLTIEKAPVPTTSQTSANVTITPQTMDNHNHGPVTTISTEYSSTLDYSKSESETRGHDLAVILVSILLVLTGVGIVSVLVMRKRWERIATVLQIPQRSGGSVLYRNSVSSLGLHTREMAVENVYQIEDNERDDYEDIH
ncbi:hepatitis A virus cellular receptor 1 homolog isoform X1 [Salmo trutta]|uniref:hepatitis A virus cellular receptor 1 homolog isoform X1 n=1 Tax=Salmo trutta TaxID=8032 RepID=UPI001131B381|nr:hepatitis A virus cellular receptor 1 homolog isoform X1 [Salmo trutta]